MAEQKQSMKDRLREITDGIEQGIKELFESDKYRQYLTTMSRFHRYSVNNTILIYLQKPDATLVAGFNKWKDQFERHVKKGEHGITIIAPTPYKKKVEEQKIDPNTKAPMLDKDGKVITEEKEIEIPMFRPVKVFDISQTDGKPLPQIVNELTGDVRQYEVFMEALKRSSKVPISMEAIQEGVDGYFSLTEQRIVIQESMSQIQTVCAVIHEMAHSMLHNYKKEQQDVGAETETQESIKRKDRHTQEVEAESISYAVCQYYGIQTGENSFGYIAGWSQGKELAELKASLENINKTANELITDIDRNYEAICKERDIDMAVEMEQLMSESGVELEKTEEKVHMQKGILTFYVAECMEFPTLGEYHENLSLTEAVELYNAIPAERMRGIKGIGFELNDGSDYEGTFPILTGRTIDMEMINEIEHFRNSSLTQKAVSDLIAIMPEMEVLRSPSEMQSGIDQKIMDNVIALLQAQPSREDVAFDINGEEYLAIQTCESGCDYTIYNGDFKELDGGQIDNHSLEQVTYELLMDEIKGTDLVEPYDYDTLMEQVAIVEEQLFAENGINEAPNQINSMLPDAKEQALDEYPMPDNEITTEDMQQYGYNFDGMLPLTKERAKELATADLVVYKLYEDNTEAMVFDDKEIDEYQGIFGVKREEWEQSPQFHDMVQERMEHQQEREQAFLFHEEDCFAIFQLKKENPQAQLRYMSMNWPNEQGLTVEHDNYDLIYTGQLAVSGSTEAKLEAIYEQFNLHHPADYHSPSLSVSDMVALKQNGVVSCHYIDSVGFKKVPNFLPENYLKNAEMAMEDDYGMIDGIVNNGKNPTVVELEQQARSGQPIFLIDLADAARREKQEKKKSVVEQLKSQQNPEHKKPVPKKSMEKEI